MREGLKGSKAILYSGQKIKVRDNHDRLFSLRFNVTNFEAKSSDLDVWIGPNTYVVDTGYVFEYDTDEDLGLEYARHCVYLRGYETGSNLLVGHNSWGTLKPEIWIKNTKH